MCVCTLFSLSAVLIGGGPQLLVLQGHTTIWQLLPLYHSVEWVYKINFFTCIILYLQACPSGTISLQVGATACQSCPTGYMCRHPASFPVCDAMAVLSRCGPGYYYSSTSNGLTCIQCDPGYACYNGRRFLCPPGFYANQSGSTNCTVCPAGYNCSDSSQNPQKCSDGQYSTQGSTECRPCVGSEPSSSNCTTTLASDSECVWHRQLC